LLRITIRVPGGPEGGDGVGMDGKVVRVAIAAVGIKGDEGLGTEAADNSYQSGYRLLSRDIHIGGRVFIFRGSGHARVAII
jgi:hypothetical protein